MKTAIFEYGKQSLAEWIEKNRDCEKMVLVGEASCDLWDERFKDKLEDGSFRIRRETNIGWHSFDLLYGFDSIAKDFHPIEFDITDMDLDINVDDLGENDCDCRPSFIFKMLANRKYGTRFVYHGDFLTTPDGKVLVHCNSEERTINVPEKTETIGRFAFASMDDYCFSMVLPEGIVNIDDFAFIDSELLHINFPDSLLSLGKHSFNGTGLGEVLLPDGIEEIPAGCFQFVYIERLRLPANLKTIRCEAFVGLECEEIRLPESVETVEWRALEGYYKKIYIPKTIQELAHDFYYEEGIDFHFEECKPQIIMY
ncbi:MAG: leucine-rich repeat protein [Prevotella sp.]|nr:leucine-rich repeat protein [Prevotella sp.]